jgi:hypothetical protein
MKKQTKVRVQQNKSGQFFITIPEDIAKNYLCVIKGDRVEFVWENRIMRIEKVEE